MKLEEKLVSLRKTNGLTQMKVAEILNVSRQAVSRWEVGDAVPSTENLKYLSNLYGIPIDYLLNDVAEGAQEFRVTEKSKESQNRSQYLKRASVLVVLMILVCILAVALQHSSVIQGQDGEDEVSIEKMEEDQLETEPETGFDINW